MGERVKVLVFFLLNLFSFFFGYFFPPFFPPFFIIITSPVPPFYVVLSFECLDHLGDILNERGTGLNRMFSFSFPFNFKRRFFLVDQ